MTAANAARAPTSTPSACAAMREAAELLASLGHEVEEDRAERCPARTRCGCSSRSSDRRSRSAIAYGELLGGPAPEDDEIEPLTRAMLEQAAGDQLGRATSAPWPSCRRWRAAIVAFFAEYDLLLTPALAERPLPIGDCNGVGERPLADLARSGAFTPFTSLFNITGQPAITVPVGFGEDALPTSVQIVGKPLGEDTLLQIAAQIEAARPWAHKRPPE